MTEPEPTDRRLPGESLAAGVRSGALWSILAMIVTRLLGLVSLLVLARLLVPSDFGVVAAIVVFLGFLELAGDGGMKASVVYEQERGITPRVQTAFTISLVASAALAALGVALAPLLAAFFRIEEHTDLFRLAAVSVLFTGLGNVADGLLQRDLQFRRRLVAEAVRASVRAGVSVALAFAGLEAASLVWGMVAGSAIWMVLLLAMTRLRPTLEFDRAAARSIGAYGAKSAVLGMVVAVVVRLDAILIGRLLGATALGLYTVAFRLPELAIQAVAWQLSTVVFPALSRKRVDDEAGLQAATVRLVRIQAIYVIPVAVAMAVLATPLVDVLFGDAWADAAPVLVPVGVLSAAFALAFPLGDLLKATGRQGVLIALNVMTAPVTVVAIVLASDQGLLAVAWARVGAAGIFVAMLVAAASRYAGVAVRDAGRALGPALLAGAGMAAGAEAAMLAFDGSWAELVAGGLAGTVVAAACLASLAPSAVTELRTALPVLDRILPPRRGARAAVVEDRS